MGTRGTKLAFGDEGRTSSQTAEVGPEGGVQAAGSMTSRAAPSTSSWRPWDKRSFATSQLPGLALPDLTASSAALRREVTGEASRVPRPLSPAPPAPPLPLELCQCPAQKLWSPALTTGALWTPRHRTHVCTHSHVHGRTHAPLQSTHSDVPTNSHFHLRAQVLLVVWGSGHLCGSLFPSAATCSQRRHL